MLRLQPYTDEGIYSEGGDPAVDASQEYSPDRNVEKFVSEREGGKLFAMCSDACEVCQTHIWIKHIWIRRYHIKKSLGA